MAVLGVAIMTASGLASTGLFLASKAAKEWKYPWWGMMLACIFSMCLGLTALALIRGTKLPPRAEARWILLRASLSGTQFILSICAVQVGASAGDVAALMSINIVGAAVLGHFFLQERINCIQGGAAFLSCAGAVLVVQPPFLFGSGTSSTSLLGCLLTVAAGFLRAGMYVSSRKCGQVSVLWPSLIVCIMCTPVFLVLTLLMDDAPVAAIFEQPLAILAFTVALLVVNVLGIVLGVLGSIMCPAAVSAGVFTTSSMLSAYLAQSLLFNHAPGAATMAGASAMLLAVFLLNFARLRSATPEIQRQSTFGPGMFPEEVASDSASGDNESLAVSDDNESLASFAAAEFAMVNPHMERVRFRKGGVAEAKVVAETIGAFDLAM